MESDLMNTVFSWSLSDLSNENLYQVEDIPFGFEKGRYLESFVQPFLEDTRARIFAALENVHRSAFAKVVSMTEKQKHPSTTSLYEVQVDSWKCPGKNFKTIPVAGIVDEGDTDGGFRVSSNCFRVKAPKEFKPDLNPKSSMFLAYLMNLVPENRTWKALHMKSFPEILNKVLHPAAMVKQNCRSCDGVSYGGVYDNFRASYLECNLNDSQTEAVEACLHKLRCEKNKCSFELIWGPPGTGKTKTISALLVALLEKKVRVVVCAPTNIAIAQVASQVMKLVAAEAGEENSVFWLGDILLVGDKDRLELNDGSAMRSIYLDCRAQMLAECVGLISSLSSMISFLEESVPQYRVFMEKELIKVEDIPGYKAQSFLDYLKDEFDCKVGPLQKRLSIVCSHFATSFAYEKSHKKANLLIHYLDLLDITLHNEKTVEAITSEELEDIFYHPESIVENLFDQYVEKSPLASVREACIFFSRCLLVSFENAELPSFRDEEKIKSFCLQTASLVFCTVSSSYKLLQSNIPPIDVLVIDEAAQIKECESMIPIQLPGIKLAILIGDERQLPALVTSNICKQAGFGRSLFERLTLNKFPSLLLKEQYRSHPYISRFPNFQFYDEMIEDAPSVEEKSYEKKYIQGTMFGPYSFLNVIDGREEMEEGGVSQKNSLEVSIVLEIVKLLHEAWLESQDKLTIGIVSPYAAQVAAIQKKLGKKYEQLCGFEVKVKTVDGFQGGEEDIIILSTVRSDHNSSLEFISNPQRVNVSLTRAKHCLWILGNETVLAGSESIWKSLVTDAISRRCFFNAYDDKTLANCIVEHKKMLNEFKDLLKPNSALLKNSKWKVIFDDKFYKSFEKIKSAQVKKAVITHIHKLSNGWRPNQDYILLAGSQNSLEISKFKLQGFYIVTMVNLQSDAGTHIQVLKIWDIVSSGEIQNSKQQAVASSRNYPVQYIHLCNEKLWDGKSQLPITRALPMDIHR